MLLDNLPEEFLLPLAFAGLFVVVLIYQIYTRTSNLKLIEKLLKAYYAEKEIQVISISSLKVADKLKYGIPLNSYIGLTTSNLNFFKSGGERFYQIVETVEASGKEHIRYVEIFLTTSVSIAVKEFDIYEF